MTRPYTRVKSYERRRGVIISLWKARSEPTHNIKQLPEPEISNGCFCLGTGFLWVDQKSGIMVRACGILHALSSIRELEKEQ